jgi:hypothetical protein
MKLSAAAGDIPAGSGSKSDQADRMTGIAAPT